MRNNKTCVWNDCSWVQRGSRRKKVIEAMNRPKTPTEIKKETKLTLSDASKTIIELVKRGIAKCLTPDEPLSRFYTLTGRGKAVRKKLFGRTFPYT